MIIIKDEFMTYGSNDYYKFEIRNGVLYISEKGVMGELKHNLECIEELIVDGVVIYKNYVKKQDDWSEDDWQRNRTIDWAIWRNESFTREHDWKDGQTYWEKLNQNCLDYIIAMFAINTSIL